ncbi:substrate-binding periplasmic protein [Rugamonas sp. CCM 8940]|uniref:substrate-binding periplasmic protein n=1 Tax=Rugamonas sp. CCM 8940 TaxID=2765359 RepID=UPI0018F6CB30|nr:transporter substrate-binding domain-containing protein [Rugamonas sp. CCM 8940]MBJ7311087.1 transporter substrate-binding domain-containing protein [Rugamonas sp. CCM 8940]
MRTVLRAVLLCWAMSLLLPAGAQGVEFHVAYEDKDSYDHTGNGAVMPDEPGVVVELVDLVQQRLPELRLRYSRKPWARCLAELEVGAVDAVFSSSFKPERLAIGVYPMHKGQVDRRFRIDSKTYSLYTKRPSTLAWDGSGFGKRSPALIALRGYAIVDDLRKQGLTVNEVNSPEDAFRMLLAGRADGFVHLTEFADYKLKKNRDFAAIAKSGPPVAVKDYYLQISHRFHNEHPALAQRIWNTLREVRQSDSERLLGKYLRRSSE